ncbi:MAG: hypothetical protein R6W70_03320 [bacterium]
MFYQRVTQLVVTGNYSCRWTVTAGNCYRIDWVVIALLQEVITLYGHPEEVTLRSDNGSQFISHKLKEYVGEAGILHEFCHVATPQQNGHVECFHSIVQRFINKWEPFETLC